MDDDRIAQDRFNLLVLHRETADKFQADRVKAGILLESGWTSYQVGQVLLIDRTLVHSLFAENFQTIGGNNEYFLSEMSV